MSLFLTAPVSVIFTLSWRWFLTWRNQYIDLLSKSLDLFLCHMDLRHERVKSTFLHKNYQVFYLGLYSDACGVNHKYHHSISILPKGNFFLEEMLQSINWFRISSSLNILVFVKCIRDHSFRTFVYVSGGKKC